MRRILRSVRRHRASNAAATVMGAIGIALMSLALAVADAALWRPLPFPAARDVVVLRTRYASPRDAGRQAGWSFPRLQYVRQRATTVDRITSWTSTSLTLTGRGEPEVISGEFVSGDYFALLGVAPMAGRGFAPDEEVAGAPRPVAIVSSSLQRQLERRGEAAALGATITLNGTAVTIVGVSPPAFAGLSGRARIWLPVPMAPVLTYPEYLATPQDFITLLARRLPGYALREVQQEAVQLAAAAQRVQPSDETAPDVTVSGDAQPLGDARVRPEGERGARLLVGGGAVLFLLTLANLVALLLGRVVARRRETAVTIAIGAPRARVWRTHAAHGALLVAAASLVALVSLAVSLRLTDTIDPLGGLGRGVLATFSALSFGWRLVGWWLLVTMLAMAIAAGVPAWWALRHATLDHLREWAHGSASTGVSLRRPGVAAGILALEGALAMVLLTAAGQLLESYRRLQRVDVGVDAGHVLTFELQPPESRVPPAQAPAFIDKVLASVRAVPGVRAASVDGGAPLAGSARTGLHIVGRPDDAVAGPPMVLRHYVAPQHFTTLGIPLLAGRGLTDDDRAQAPRVTVISASAARRYFPAGDALGRRVWFTGSTLTSPDSSAEIVGIVGDVTYDSPIGEPTTASFYTPYAQFTYGWRVYFVKVAGNPRAMVRAVAEGVHRVAPDLPLRNVRPLEDIVAASHAPSRSAARGTAALALLGLLLATSGIWAVVSHATAQRRRDMAIRIAHGAARWRVVRLVLGDGLLWPALGLALGSALAVTTSGVLRAMLYGIAPGEPSIVLAGAVAFLLAACGACLLPAWRAALVSPMEVLRGD